MTWRRSDPPLALGLSPADRPGMVAVGRMKRLILAVGVLALAGCSAATPPATPNKPQAQYEQQMIQQVMRAKPGMTRAQAEDWLKQMEHM